MAAANKGNGKHEPSTSKTKKLSGIVAPFSTKLAKDAVLHGSGESSLRFVVLFCYHIRSLIQQSGTVTRQPTSPRECRIPYKHSGPGRFSPYRRHYRNREEMREARPFDVFSENSPRTVQILNTPDQH